MLKLLASILFVAALTLGGCDDSPDAPADNRTAGDKVETAGEKVGDALDQAAQKTGEVVGEVTDDTVQLARETREQGQKAAATAVPSDARAIHNVIAQLAEAAMSPGKFGEIIERLAEADRTRIGDYATRDHPDLNDITAKGSAAWNKQFGHSFDVEDETKTFGAGSPITLGGGGKTATVPLGALTIPFVREPGGWRVDAPDVLTGEGLKNALIHRLDAIGNGTTALPKAEAEAHQLVARQVLEAILTTDQPKSPAVPLR